MPKKHIKYKEVFCMKKMGKRFILIAALVIVFALGLTSCNFLAGILNPDDNSDNQSTKPDEEEIVKFVGSTEIDGTNYDVEVSLEVEDGANICYLSVNGVSSIDGTWTLTDGWGYSFTFNDAMETEVRAGYYTEEGKHSFDYYLNVGNNKAAIITLSYVEAGYVLAADYELPVVEAELLVFNGVLSMYGMTENLILECLPGGNFAFTTNSVLNASYTGTYTAEDGVYTFSFADGANNVVSTLYNADKDAYAFAYPLDIGMGAPVTVYLFSSADATVEDFEFPSSEPEEEVKEALYTFTDAGQMFTSTLTMYDDETLEITVLMGEQTVHSAEGIYSIVNDTFYIQVGEATTPISSTKADGYYVIEYAYDLAGNAMTASFKMEIPAELYIEFEGASANGLVWIISLYTNEKFELAVLNGEDSIHTNSGTWVYDADNDKYVLTDANAVVYESTKTENTYAITYSVSMGGHDLSASLEYTPVVAIGSFYGELTTSVNYGGNAMNITFGHTITLYSDGTFTYVKTASGSTMESYSNTYTFADDVYSIVFNSASLQQTLTSVNTDGTYTIAFPDPAQDIILTYTPVEA